MALNTNLWNRIRYTLFSPFYDWIASFPAYRRRAMEIFQPQAGERILIVGAGTGNDIPYIPQGVHITATDLTPAMVERLRAKSRGGAREVEAMVMDGQSLEFPDHTFDGVILHLILAVIPDPGACMREAARVLKPGGRIIVMDKFLPDGEEPSVTRRFLNLFTNFAFSNINRHLGPLVAENDLVFEHREGFSWLGLPFQIALLRKAE